MCRWTATGQYFDHKTEWDLLEERLGISLSGAQFEDYVLSLQEKGLVRCGMEVTQPQLVELGGKQIKKCEWMVLGRKAPPPPPPKS